MNPILKSNQDHHDESPSSSNNTNDNDESKSNTNTDNTNDNLTEQLLYRAPASLQASVLQPKFRELYNNHSCDLSKALWRVALPSFAPAAICQLATVLAQVSVPLFVWRLLQILETNPSSNVFASCIPYVFSILLADVINALTQNRQRFLAMRSGAAIRAALIASIYDRVLHLTPAGKAGLTSGGVANLFAVDTQKLFEVTAEGHLLWSAPLSMILVAVLLVVIVGPSMAVGIALLLLFVPIVKRISNRMMEIRKQRVKVTDRRVEIVNAMLQSINVTKLNNYEERYISKLEAVRREELILLKRELYVWSLVMAVQFVSPLVASVGAFAAYVYTGNVLTTADAFTALLLFNGLRFPINYASRLIGKLAQARESARRISAFMKRETMPSKCCEEEEIVVEAIEPNESNLKEKESINNALNGAECEGPIENHASDEGSNLLDIQNGVFGIGTEACDTVNANSGEEENGFVVRDINMSVCAGEILAIVGPVGRYVCVSS